MKKLPKTTGKMLRYVSLVIVLLFIAVVVYLGVIVRDIKPFDDSDMKIVLKNVPDEQNAYHLIMLAQIPEIQENESHSIFFKLQRIDSRIQKDVPLGDRELKDAEFYFKERIEIVDRASKMKYSQGWQYTDPDDNRNLRYNFSVDYIAKLRLALAEREYAAKDNDALLQTGIDMAKFGQLMEQNEGGSDILGTLLRGERIKRHSLAKVNKYLDEGHFTDNPQKMTASLGEIYESDSAWANAWKADYQIVSYVLNTYDSYKMNPNGYLWKEFGMARNPVSRYMITLLLKTERSRKAMHDLSKFAINENGRARFCSQLDRSVVKERLLLWDRPFTLKTLRLILRGEYGPRFFQEMYGSLFSYSMESKFYIDTLTDFTRLRIAALAYNRDHGELPLSLDALVPEYIDKIPFDRFDGKQIRYNRDRKIIYSAGLNGVDDGGSFKCGVQSSNEKCDWRKQKDLALQIMK